MTIYVLQADYGYGDGWEDITAEETPEAIEVQLEAYRFNEGNNRYRIVEQEEHEWHKTGDERRTWMECAYCPAHYRPDIGEGPPDTPCEGERD